MDTTRTDHADTSVITLAGHVRASDVARLRAELLSALEDGQRDLFVDARELDVFDDDASSALVAGRYRAKARRHRLVVVDALDGALATSLRRTGLLFKLPIYADAGAADAGVAADRDDLVRRSRFAPSERPAVPDAEVASAHDAEPALVDAPSPAPVP